MSQKDGAFKPAETVHGDNPAGVRESDTKGKEIDPVGIKPARPEMDEQRLVPDGPKTGVDKYKLPLDHVRPMPENPVTDHPRPVLSQPPNSYRPPAPQIMQNQQMRPMGNHVGPGMPNQQMRQPYPNQPRPPGVYQGNMPYPPQLPMRVDAPRPNNQPPIAAGQPPMQRMYGPGQPHGDMSQQNRMMNPAGVRPPINRPPMYANNSAQRPMLDNYQKGPNMQPVRPSIPNGQNQPVQSPNPPNQYYNPVRPPVTLNAAPPVGVPTVGDGSVRTYITTAFDPSQIKQPNPPGNAVGGPVTAPSNPVPDPSRNKPAAEPYQKKTESLDVKPTPEEAKQEDIAPTIQSKPAEGVGTEKKKEEKESGIVLANVKFFEERDTAKTPLTPKITSPARPTPPSRSATFVATEVVKEDRRKNVDYESGVDEEPLMRPRLRSAFAEKPLHLYGKSGRSRVRSGRGDSNSSCPPTPIKTSTARGDFAMSRTPSKSYKSIFEISPEEELLFFFNLAKANYHSYFDRHHESRIDQNSRRKENMPTANGDVHGVKKTPTRLPAPSKRSSSAHGPSTPLKSPGVPKSLPKTPDSPVAPEPLIKKVPMNKIQVGAAPSPNLKAVKSKIGSLANTTHKPGGGNVKIESHKVDFSKAQPRIAAKNDTYAPGGGDKKIQQVKLQWQAKPKVGSLENAQHKPGGGDKKIESVKLDFKDKAKPKVGSKDNVKHVPGGGAVKNYTSPVEWKSMDIESQKLEFKAQSKVGSLDNVKHKPGGGDVKIFDDKTYLKQISCGSSEGRASGTQSYCDLSVVSEVHSVSAPGTPHRGTAIKIKKSTTLGRTKPGIQKTTEVTVVSRSPSIERKDMPKSSSMHEVKLTYAKVASPKHGKPGLDNVGPIEVVNVPAQENAAIFKPDDTPVEVKNLISSFEQHITNQKGLPIMQEGKGYVKTRPEPHQESRAASQLNEELNQKFGAVKEELDRVTQEKKEELRGEESTNGVDTVSKFMQNEMAAHEKVGEIWKEVHNIGPDKTNPPKPEETQPPPPPPTPSVAQRPPFQPQQPPPNMRMRAPYPQQMPPGQRPPMPQQQFNMQRPTQMAMPQRPPFPQNQQPMRPPFMGPQGQRQPYPELGSGPFPIRPQQPPSPMTPSQMANSTLPK